MGSSAPPYGRVRRVARAASVAFVLTLVPSGRTATLVASEGGATIEVAEKTIKASEAQGAKLPEGSAISCGDGARAVIEFAPGLAAVVLPNTKFVIGATAPVGPSVGADGKPLPAHGASCERGTVVLLATDRGLGAASLEISTPKGNVSPVLPGRAAVSVGTVAEGSAVTSVAPTGVLLVTAPGGEQIPLPRGMGIALGSAAKRPVLLADLPRGPQLKEAADSAASSPLVSVCLPWGVP